MPSRTVSKTAQHPPSCPWHYFFVMMGRDIAIEQILSVACPMCGAPPKQQCELSTKAYCEIIRIGTASWSHWIRRASFRIPRPR